MKINKITASLALLLASTSTLAVAGVGGGIEFTYDYSDFSPELQDRKGDISFSQVVLTYDDSFGENSEYGVSVNYRLKSGYDYLKHGYFWYKANDDLTFNAGLIRKPAGSNNLTSHNWWYSLNYYYGIEDDYGLGVSMDYRYADGFQTEIAYLSSSAYGDGRDFAGTVSKATYEDMDYNSTRSNTIAARQSYRYDQDNFALLVGASVEYGQLYDDVAGENGDSFNYTAFFDATYEGYQLQLQYAAVDFDQYDDGLIDTDIVIMGLGNGTYGAAAKANTIAANLSKKVPTTWGSITFYNDYSVVSPDLAEFDKSYVNTTGMYISYGKFNIYVDHYLGKNTVWLGDTALGLADDADDSWNSRFTIALSYYF